MNDEKPCGTCGLMNVGSNGVVITDMKKHLASPIPCPECMERGKAHFAELGRQFAEKVNDAVMNAVMGEWGPANER